MIDLRKLQRKEPEKQTEKQLYQVRTLPSIVCGISGYRPLNWFCSVYNRPFCPFSLKILEQKEERIAPGAIYGSSHTYVTLTTT